MNLSLIAAVDEHMGIGKANQLLCYLPKDLARFKQITMGKPIIMGRKTFESIGRPLPGRRNMVISSRLEKIDGIEVFPTIEKALDECKDEADVFVIGGGLLYETVMDRADRLYLSHIHATFEADTFFPELNKREWVASSTETFAADQHNQYRFSLVIYDRK